MNKVEEKLQHINCEWEFRQKQFEAEMAKKRKDFKLKWAIKGVTILLVIMDASYVWHNINHSNYGAAAFSFIMSLLMITQYRDIQ